MSIQHQKPHEKTYRDYREAVSIYAEAAKEKLADYADDYADVHAAVSEAVEGTEWVHDRGHILMTVLLSDQDPDQPDYAAAWTQRADLSEDMTYSDAVGAMAYACFFSDVMEKLHRDRDGGSDV